MEKRLILAIVLSFLVLFGYQALFNKPDKTPPKPEVPAASAPLTPVPGTAGAMQEQQKAVAPEAKPAPALPPQDLSAVAGRAESDIVVDTPLYRAVWSNKGGVLKSWKLKTYKNSLKEDLEIVPALAAEIGRFPFSLGLDDTALAALLNSSLFETSGAGLELAAGAKGEIRFVFSDGASVRAEKIYGFTGGTYTLTTEVRVWKNGQAVTPSVLWGPGISNLTPAEAKQSYSATRGSAVYTGGKVFRMNERKFKPGANTFNFVDWAAYEENYFVALFLLPPQKGQAAFLQEAGETAGGRVPAYFVYATEPTQAFIGPKDVDALKALGRDTKKVIN
ncbi:MAG TPA: membrane protein insertase YidC, partial [Acidobacteriota bacterium]|nr:membrane protein insertase YidC [Acidobacteriota bacterium]